MNFLLQKLIVEDNLLYIFTYRNVIMFDDFPLKEVIVDDFSVDIVIVDYFTISPPLITFLCENLISPESYVCQVHRLLVDEFST